MNESVLLVEPAYRAKYPPLGLMKISQFHNQRGDKVQFVRGLDPKHRDHLPQWDRVYVSTLFTYDWAETVSTLRYYQRSVKEPSSENLVVGGVMATLMADELRKEVPCRVVTQLLDQKGKLAYEDDGNIDSMLPDYDLLKMTDYVYPISNAYFLYATRGCSRNCSFCAVGKIEPDFKHFIPLADKVAEIKARYGQRRDLILLDNNVLQSARFPDIIQEIEAAGFAKGETLTYKGKNERSITVRRRVDFNQGIDIRLLKDKEAGLLSQIAIDPLRLAFDHIADKRVYEAAVKLAVKHKICRLSNYVLYNYDDTPEDLYERLRINVRLNEKLGVQLFSFPMRYISLNSKDRLATTSGNVGKHWRRKYLRAIQCVLIPTYGAVTHRLDFFNAAFGKDLHEFRKILLMPEDYIIHRRKHEDNGSTERWWKEYRDLSPHHRKEFLSLLLDHRFKHMNGAEPSLPVSRLLCHYRRASSGQPAVQYATTDTRIPLADGTAECVPLHGPISGPVPAG